MTDFQTFAVNLAIAVLKIHGGQRYGDEHDLLNMITSMREASSASSSSSSQQRPGTRDQQTQTNATTSKLGRHITILPRASSKNKASVDTSTSRKMSVDTSAEESGQDTQDYDNNNNDDDDNDDEPLVRRRDASPASRPQPTPPILEYNHESSSQFPNGDVTFSNNHMPGQTALDTRSVGWAFFVYKTETYKNHKTFRKSCLGIYMCPECKTIERPRIPHTGQHYKHKPPFPPKTTCCNGQAPIHIPCMCLLRIDDDGTTCTFQHQGYHNHPKPQTIRPSRAGKRRFAEIIETVPGVGPADLVSGSTNLPPLSEIDPFYADSEHVAYHRRRLMRAAERASAAASSETNEGSRAAAATGSGTETSTTMTMMTTATADSSSINSPSMAGVHPEGGGRGGSIMELPGGGPVSQQEVSSNASVAQAVTAFMRALSPMPSAATTIPSGSSAIPSGSSTTPSTFSVPTLSSTLTTSSANPSTSSAIPTITSSEDSSSSSPSTTITDAMARTSTLRTDSTEVAMNKVSVRGIRPVCLSCGEKIDRGLQRLVFTGPDANKRYKKNESCHVQGACVDALSPELKALAYAFWQKTRS